MLLTKQCLFKRLRIKINNNNHSKSNITTDLWFSLETIEFGFCFAKIHDFVPGLFSLSQNVFKSKTKINLPLISFTNSYQKGILLTITTFFFTKWARRNTVKYYVCYIQYFLSVFLTYDNISLESVWVHTIIFNCIYFYIEWFIVFCVRVRSPQFECLSM